jgi:predicted secreted hydrolase
MLCTEIDATLGARNDYETEWWYYHGYLQAGEKRFAFHFAYFRRRTNDVWIGSLLPLRWLGKHARFAHFGLTDFEGRRFWYGHQRSIFNHSGTLSNKYQAWIHEWSIGASGTTHYLRAALKDVGLHLQFSPLKPPANHQHACGLSDEPERPACYWSYPRMEIKGSLTVEGETVDVSGTAWMDRAYGRLALNRVDGHVEGWDWFGIQLDDGRELMLYEQPGVNNAMKRSIHATLVDDTGKAEYLNTSDFAFCPQSYWTSPHTGLKYPSSWKISSQSRELSLFIQPWLRIQELDTRGSTCLMYWEGPVEVEGTLDGRVAKGRGFVELVGYDRRHVRWGRYDFGRKNLSWFGLLKNEYWFRQSRKGIMETDELP